MKLSSILISLILSSLMFTLLPQNVSASEFDQSYIRLDRVKKNTQTGALVCAAPQTAGVENKVVITFPSQITVNQTFSNWTVSTTDLPDGATAWPGIGTAVSVAGDTITFPSSDLNLSTLYCFNISGTNTLTTPNSVGFYQIQLSTQNNGSLTIDASEQGISILNDDQISVSAATELTASDLQNEISSDTDNLISQDTNITYTIKYGNRSSIPASISIEATWTRGTFEGDPVPSEDILSYRFASATTGYNNVAPIVDLQNRKIIWNIGTIAGNTTDQTVSFILHTYDHDNGNRKLNFDVSSQVLATTIASAVSTKTIQYLYYNPNPVTTIIPPTQPAPSPTSVPRTGPFLTSVEIIEVSNTGFKFKMSGENIETITILYGTSPNKLDKTLRIPNWSPDVPIELKDLAENTSYYFQIKLTSKNGSGFNSDIFFVPTSSKEINRENPFDSLIVTSLNNILYGGGVESSNFIKRLITLAESSVFEFKLKLAQKLDIKQIAVYLAPKNSTDPKVLAITTANAAENVGETTILSEINLGNFFGRLRTPNLPGLYEVRAKIADYQGNVFEAKLFDIVSVKPITVFSSSDNKPVEGARIYFYAMNLKDQTFQPLSPQVLSLTNPSHTDSNGKLNINLPVGKYRLEILAIGFKDKTVDFEITESGSEDYPNIYLDKDPEVLMNAMRYFARTAQDLITLLNLTLGQLSSSSRLFDLLSFSILAIFVLGSWIALITKLRIPTFQLPAAIFTRTKNLLKKSDTTFQLRIKFTEGHHPPFTLVVQNQHRVVIFEKNVESAEKEIVCARIPAGYYRLELIHEGESEKIIDFHHYSDKPINVDLSKSFAPHPLKKLGFILLEFIGLSFEFLLIFSIILEFAFVYTFGLLRVLPFLFLTIVNVLIFIQFVRINKSKV